MSNFHRVKDRLPDGKAPAHHRLKYASRDGTKYIHHRDRDDYLQLPHCNFSKNPGWWNNIYTTRRRRAADRMNCRRVMRSSEELSWMPDKRPTTYYW